MRAAVWLVVVFLAATIFAISNNRAGHRQVLAVAALHGAALARPDRGGSRRRASYLCRLARASGRSQGAFAISARCNPFILTAPVSLAAALEGRGIPSAVQPRFLDPASEPVARLV